ncbi:unnamed protein product [Pelagomonas calceolata]|uniref:Uncharacterized protein n=1 Tax=Pelagomonas calceolata TaxID=35677 RepID=A0A8J2SMT3_9STRA|nr:unnamed protein product [Pelagomonas calceolata]
MTAAAKFRDNVVAFTALPNSVRLVLLLVFLNSFRSFGLRFVQQLYLTNEFGHDDLEAASVLGTSASLHVAFGLIGAVLTDAVGVRRVALTALSVSVVGRGLLAFGRSRTAIHAAFYLFSPAGEALLATGLYRVALKKLTTPKTRAFAFAVEYATFNLSGALADVCIDAFRRRGDALLFGEVYTPTRQFLVLTFVVVCASWLLVALHLRDESVVEADDGSPVASAPPPTSYSLTAWRAWQTREAARQAATLRVVASHAGGRPSAKWSDVAATLRTREIWRVVAMSLAVFGVAKQWTEVDQLLPPFLERQFGEGGGIFLVHSVGMWGCFLLPPIVAAFTSDSEAFRIIVPGVWIMATSPIAMIVSPTAPGAVVWEAWLTAGEVLWSPRQQAWAVSLAPPGREGLFLALASLKDLFLAWPSTVLVGWLNREFNPNCPGCRDELGRFCAVAAGDACVSAAGGTCAAALSPSCPAACPACPGFTDTAPDPRTVWLVVLALSLTSPLLIVAGLPFLRDGVLSFGRDACGTNDDEERKPLLEEPKV